MHIRDSDRRRFLAKIEPSPDGCWLWTGGKANGYGSFRFGSKNLRAHRFAYELFVGPIEHGKVICHRCDMRTCVRPDHLFMATQRDNIQDAIAKGRFVFTGSHPAVNRKLTEDAVRDIRESYARGVTTRSLATKYGITLTLVRLVIKRQRWAHVA